MSDLNMCGLCSYLVYIKYLHFRNIDFAAYIRIRVPTPPPTSRIRRASDEKSLLARLGLWVLVCQIKARSDYGVSNAPCYSKGAKYQGSLSVISWY